MIQGSGCPNFLRLKWSISLQHNFQTSNSWAMEGNAWTRGRSVFGDRIYITTPYFPTMVLNTPPLVIHLNWIQGAVKQLLRKLFMFLLFSHDSKYESNTTYTIVMQECLGIALRAYIHKEPLLHEVQVDLHQPRLSANAPMSEIQKIEELSWPHQNSAVNHPCASSSLVSGSAILGIKF